MTLNRCFEDEDFIYFHKRSNKNHYFFRGEKHKTRIWNLKRIPLIDFVSATKTLN
jgi:hypothetical protein